MDPRTNVVEAEVLAKDIIRRSAGSDGSHALENAGQRLAELFLALHEWRMSGGFDPYADPDAPQVNPQANALLHRVKVNKASRVYCPPGAGLPDDYVLVIEANPPGNHAFECGIAPDGRVSS